MKKPTRVVLDTSVYVSALLSRGDSARVFEGIIEGKVANFYTESIIAELREVLSRRKFSIEKEKQEHFIHLVQEVSFEVVELKECVVKRCRDPKDDKFLSLSRQVDAHYLLSWDDDLLVLKSINSTRVLTPTQFLARIFKD